MSKTVDERVVEMRFDNKDFEKNVSQSMSTLDKLKQKLHLDGEAKGLENIGAASQKCASNMAPLGSAVDSVKMHFSALEVAGITAMSNLTNKVVNAAEQLIRSLTIAPLADGWHEYEMTMNAIKTTMSGTGKTAEEVQEQLKRLDKYADDTVYSSADMFNNLPKFTNAGVELTKATTAMIGIANATALAGGDASKASIAFYNLGQSIGTGYLSRMDYNSINNAGIATMEWKKQMIEAAMAEGTLKQAGEDLYETNGKQYTLQSLFIDGLQEQWASTNVLMKVFEDYGNTETEIGNKAQHAAQDLRTFSQMMESLKAQAGTGWKDTWQLIFGDLDQATALWTGIGKTIGGVIDSFSAARNNFLKSLLTSKWDSFSEKLSSAGIDVNKFKEALIDAGKTSGKITDDMGVDMDHFEESLSKKWLSGDLILDTLKTFTSGSAEVSTATEDMTAKLETFQKVVDEVWSGAHDNGEARIKSLESKGYEYAKVQDLVNKTVDGHRLTIEDLSDAQLENVGCTQEQIDALHKLQSEAEATGTPLNELIKSLEKPSGRELIIDTISTAVKSLGRALNAIGDAWSEVFTMDGAVDGAYSFIEVLHDIVKNIEFTDEDAENLKETFKGIFTILKLFTDLAGGGFMLTLKGINFILGLFDLSILDVTGAIGKAITKFDKWFRSSTLVSKSLEVIKDAIKWLVNGVIKLNNKLGSIPIVQKAIEQLHDSVTDFFENSDEYFDAGQKKVETWIGAFKSLPVVSEAISAMKSSFSDGKTAFDEFIERTNKIDDLTFDNIGKVITDFFTNVVGKFLDFDKGVDGFKKSCTGIKSTLSELSDKVFPSYSKSGNDIKKAGELVTSGFTDTALKTETSGTKLSDSISGVQTVLKGFTNWISDMASRVNFGEILAAAFGTTFIVSAVQVFKFGKAVTGLIGSISGVFGSVSEVVTQFSKGVKRFMKDFGTSMKNVSKSMKYKAIGAMIWDIAKAFLVIAGAIALLSKLDSDGLKQGLLALGLVLGSMIGLIVVLNKFPVKDTIKVSSVLMAMAGAVMILSLSMKMLAGVDFISALGATFLLGLLITELVIALGIINHMGITVEKGAGVMLGLSTSLVILSLAVKMIADLEFEKAYGAVILLNALMVSMTACLVLIGLTGSASKKGATALILMAGAMLLLTVVIKIISKFTTGEILAAIGTMVAMGILIGAMVLMMKLIGDSGQYAAKAGAMMLAFGLSLLAMVASIKIMAGMSLADIAKGSVAILAFAAACGILVAFTKSSGQYAAKAAAVVLAFGAAMIALSVSLFILSSLDTKGLIVGSIVIYGLIGMMTLLIQSTKNATNASKTILAVALVIGTMAAVIAILSIIDTDKVLVGTLFVTSIMGMMALLVNSQGMSKKAMASVLLVTGVIAAIGGILYLMNDMDAQTAVATSAAISMILLSMSVACAVLNGSGMISPMALVSIGILTVIVAAIGGILYLMNDMDASSALQTATAISELVLSMSAALILLEAAGLVAGAALVGIVSLVALVVAMGGLMLAIGALNALMGSTGKEFLENSIPILGLIGTGIGTFIGSIVGSFMGSVSEGFVEVGVNLSLFMMALQPFLMGLKSMDSTAIDGAKSLAEMILILTAAELIQGLTSFITGGSSITDFADQLVPFGEAIVAFSDTVAGKIDATSVEAAANAGKIMAEMASSLPNSGGVVGFFAGENDMDDFGSKLEAFGVCIVAFSAIVKGRVDEEAIQAAANAGKMMTDMAATIPNTGGLVSFFTGDNDLATFGEQLLVFGACIVAFSAIVKDRVDEDAIKAAADAGKMMTEMQSTIPDTGGVVDFFTGDNDLATFGEQLVSFGTAIVTFSNTLTEGDGINSDAIQAASDAGSIMAALATTLPDTKGVVGFFTGGTMSLDDFGDELESYGKGISKYSTALADVDTDIINSVSEASVDLIALTKSVPEECNLDTFGSSLSAFGEDLSDFYDSISDIDETTFSGLITQTRNLFNLMTDLGDFDGSGVSSFSTSLSTFTDSGLDSFISSFSSSNEKFSSAGNNIVTALTGSISSNSGKMSAAISNLISLATTTLKGKQVEFKNLGKLLAEKIGSGLESGRGSIISSIRSILSGCTLTMSGQYSSYYNAGSYLVQGFAMGIDDGTWRAEAKSKAMAKASYAAAMKELDAHSPSRKFIKGGSFVPAGFAIGIMKYAYRVKTASKSMASTAIDAMNESINQIGDMVNSGMDTTPTIRPVLDLSNIQNGVGRIGGMFGDNYGISAMANSIASGSVGKQGTSNGDVVTAINKLRKDIGNVQGNTYTINGITYDDGSNVSEAVETLVRAARVGRRV